MTDARIGPNGREDELTSGLRGIYAAPAEPRYWAELEARIMARIAGDDAWWLPFGDWVRVGLVAAGIAGMVAVAGLVRARQDETRVAVETIVDTPRELPQQMATGTTGLSVPEATLRYVIQP